MALCGEPAPIIVVASNETDWDEPIPERGIVKCIIAYGFEVGSDPSARLRDDARDGCAMNFEQAGDFGGRLASG